MSQEIARSESVVIVISDLDSSLDSEKHAKFRAIAEKRTNRAIEAIHRIGKLSNRQLYRWEEAEVRKILKALRDATSEIESRFSSPRSTNSGTFRL